MSFFVRQKRKQQLRELLYAKSSRQRSGSTLLSLADVLAISYAGEQSGDGCFRECVSTIGMPSLT
jgi:hypothetical protein